jgi:anti-anti-sigma factor
VPQLNVALVPGPDQVVVRIVGDADLATVPLLTDALVQAAGLGTLQVVVDVAGVRFWDASCLSALARFTADLATGGRSCRLAGAPAATRRLVVAAALSDRLELDGPVQPAAVLAPDRAHEPNVVADVPAPRPTSAVALSASARRAEHLAR